MKKWNIIVKDGNTVIDRFTVRSASNLMALLLGQNKFLEKHKNYDIVDCGMWMDKDTCQRDLTVHVQVPVGYIEKYFSIEIE